MAHGLKLHTFCTLLWGKQPIWNRDIDKCADGRILTVLECRTGATHERILATTLAAYEGKLYERHNALGNTFWIMPLGIYHRVRRMHGVQFCARCLAEDKEPYFRRTWRLALATVCIKHRCTLYDACPRCDAPVNFHRDELGERGKQVATTMARCFVCRFDLRESSISAACEVCDDSLKYQSGLIEAMESGWIEVAGQRTYALLYFPVLHQLMKILAVSRGGRLLAALCRETGTPPLMPIFPTGRTDIESLRTPVRHQIKMLAAYLLDDWPERFIRICSVGRVWSSTLLRDFESAPFWYWSIVREHLYRKSYCAADTEVASAIAHINGSGGIPYQKAISHLLGARDVFRKRKTFTAFSCKKIGRATVKVVG